MALLGLLLGSCLLLFGVQWLFDLGSLSNRGQSGPFLTINKPVSFLNSIAGPGTFDAEEMREIKEMEGVNKLAAFKTNQFKLRASVASLGFRSELFFESLPEEMLLDAPANFKWFPGEKMVPILLPKDYIALYNFGFAPSQGLPQVSPALIEQFSFSLEMEGEARRGIHRGKIVGLSEQLNTILVPNDFLQWANTHYAGVQGDKPTRLAIASESGNVKRLRDELEEAGYELGGHSLINEQIAGLLRLALLGIISIGLLIFLLAVYVAYQYRQLFFTHQKNNLIRLFEFGQDPQLIYTFLNKHFRKVILLGLGGGLLVFILLNFLLKSWMQDQGFVISTYPNLLTLLIGLLLLTLIIINQRKQLQRFLESCYN